MTPRSFRKTVATELDRVDGPERAASQLGHPDNRVTRKHYIQPLVVVPESETLGRLARKNVS